MSYTYSWADGFYDTMGRSHVSHSGSPTFSSQDAALEDRKQKLVQYSNQCRPPHGKVSTKADGGAGMRYEYAWKNGQLPMWAFVTGVFHT